MPKTRRKTPPVTLAGNRHAVRDTLATLRNRGAVSSEMPTPERIIQARGAVEIGRAETVVDASRKDGVISQPRVRLSDDPWARIKASPKLHADPDMRRLLGEAGDRFAQDHWAAFGSDLSAMDPSREGGCGATDGWFASDYKLAASKRWSKAVDALDDLIPVSNNSKDIRVARFARFAADAVCIRGWELVDVGRRIPVGRCGLKQSNRKETNRDNAMAVLSHGCMALAKHYGLVR